MVQFYHIFTLSIITFLISSLRALSSPVKRSIILFRSSLLIMLSSSKSTCDKHVYAYLSSIRLSFVAYNKIVYQICAIIEISFTETTYVLGINHTHTHARTHARTHTHTHTYTCTHTHMHTHTCVHNHFK